MKKLQVLISLGLFCFCISACGHKHTFSEATCIEPKVCSECGETEGEPLGHTMDIEATCTEPKTCSTCGETEGEALGHSTDLGKCANCGISINEDVLSDIKEKLDDIKEYTSNATNIIAQDTTYASCLTACSQLKIVESIYGEINELCGDINKLEDFKKTANDALSNLPTSISSESIDDVRSFIENYMIFLNKAKNAEEEFSEIK